MGLQNIRTTYDKPNSHANFARAIEVLNAYMHLECFSYYEGEKSTTDMDKPVNGKGNQQLWQRFKNEKVEDCELLENASPGKLLKIA